MGLRVWGLRGPSVSRCAFARSRVARCRSVDNGERGWEWCGIVNVGSSDERRSFWTEWDVFFGLYTTKCSK